jgi:hypothetical protein
MHASSSGPDTFTAVNVLSWVEASQVGCLLSRVTVHHNLAVCPAGTAQFVWVGQQVLSCCWTAAPQPSAAPQHRTWACTGLPTGVMWKSCSS